MSGPLDHGLDCPCPSCQHTGAATTELLRERNEARRLAQEWRDAWVSRFPVPLDLAAASERAAAYRLPWEAEP